MFTCFRKDSVLSDQLAGKKRRLSKTICNHLLWSAHHFKTPLCSIQPTECPSITPSLYSAIDHTVALRCLEHTSHSHPFPCYIMSIILHNITSFFFVVFFLLLFFILQKLLSAFFAAACKNVKCRRCSLEVWLFWASVSVHSKLMQIHTEVIIH